jgi:hypothetical protein
MGVQDWIASMFLSSFLANVGTLLVGVAIIVVSIIVLSKIKNFMVNAVLGAISLFVANAMGFNVPLSLATIVVALIFGPAGVGVVMVLSFFGVSLR